MHQVTDSPTRQLLDCGLDSFDLFPDHPFGNGIDDVSHRFANNALRELSEDALGDLLDDIVCGPRRDDLAFLRGEQHRKRIGERGDLMNRHRLRLSPTHRYLSPEYRRRPPTSLLPSLA